MTVKEVPACAGMTVKGVPACAGMTVLVLSNQYYSSEGTTVDRLNEQHSL
jgi:hypothetical protein